MSIPNSYEAVHSKSLLIPFSEQAAWLIMARCEFSKSSSRKGKNTVAGKTSPPKGKAPKERVYLPLEKGYRGVGTPPDKLPAGIHSHISRPTDRSDKK